MKLALAIALMAIAIPSTALSGSQTFLCVGTGISEGYPFGKMNTGRVQLQVTVANGTVTVIDHANGNFCSKGAECASSISAKAIAASVRNVPHRDPLYSSNFRMDVRTKRFVNSGGGLDGGWSQSGKCKVAPAARHKNGH